MRLRSLRDVPAIAALAVIICAFALNPVELGAQEGAQATSSDPPSLTNTNPGETEAYWTPELLATAKPMPLPEVIGEPETEPLTEPPQFTISLPGKPPTLSAPSTNSSLFTAIPRESDESELSNEPEAYGGFQHLRFTSSRLVTDSVAALGGEKTYPYTIEGQLSFTIPSGLPAGDEKPGNYVCSATVQTIGVITTAGHCVSDGHKNFYKNWVFVPATRSGSAPFGSWTWSSVTTTPTWFTGGGGVPNAQDVAVIVLKENAAGKRIGSLTGWAGFTIPDLYGGQQVSVLGYPCNLDNCAKDHRTDAQVSGGSNNTDIIGSDATGGASGGGWIINFGQYASGEPISGESDDNSPSLVAVTSYGPTNSWGYLGASILNSGYVSCTPLNTCNKTPTAILNSACVKNPGAC